MAVFSCTSRKRFEIQSPRPDSIIAAQPLLLELGVGPEGVPSVVESAVAKVTGKFRGIGGVLHDECLEDIDQEEDLRKAGSGNSVGPDDRGGAVGKRVEGVAIEVDVPWEVEARVRHEVADEGEHGDAPVLEIHVAEALELLPVTVRA